MRIAITLLTATVLCAPAGARADEFCEPAAQDCRARLLSYINAERVRLDLGLEEITDTLIADAVIARFNARVPVRMLVEPRRNASEPLQTPILAKLKAAGIPMRYRAVGDILHWKMTIFSGQNVVQFSAAQYTTKYLVPVTPYVEFTQDPLFFSTDGEIVNSFRRKFDDAWVDTATFANYANSTLVARAYDPHSIAPSMNFVPAQNFLTRSTPLYDAEATGIDVIMYKITTAGHPDAMIRAVKRGVPVRLITEPNRYRNPANIWQAYYLDQMYAAGVRIRDRAHRGFLHQKTTLLYSQRRTIFGSSNWTALSSHSQYEHNYFAVDPLFFEWFRKVFVRKWGTAETKAFVPLPPDAPIYVAPANTAGGQSTTVVLSWKPGPWAHLADVYLGTSSTPPLYMKDVAVPVGSTKKLTVTVATGQAYYWKIVSKTMAGKTASGPVWSFGT